MTGVRGSRRANSATGVMSKTRITLESTMPADFKPRSIYSSVARVGQTFVWSVCCALVCGSIAQATDAPSAAAPTKLQASTVGLPIFVEQIVLPGSELEPVPWDDKSPVVVRIIEVYPHGDAFRYDLSYQGLEPGDYDLRKFLRRKDGSLTENLPPLAIHIDTLLPPGQVQPNNPGFQSLPWLGGYRLLAIGAALAWIAGLIWIAYPRRGKQQNEAADAAPQLSLADRLRPLVTKATAGELSPAQLSELERALTSYWRHRLDLDALPPAEALAQLKSHAEAGPLIRQLEVWLHSQAGASNVDIGALLAPYRNLPADTLDRASRPLEAPAR
jgi:hypothetical protein